MFLIHILSIKIFHRTLYMTLIFLSPCLTSMKSINIILPDKISILKDKIPILNNRQGLF